jgi:hypothetical protein
MCSDNQTLCSCPVYMPDGSIMPELLTEQEAIVFLRLDTEKNAPRTLKYYRDKGHLRGLQIGRNFLYPKRELLDFIAMATDWFNRDKTPENVS